MIKLENIKKEYVVKKSVAVALNEVSLTLPDKGLVFVVGRSGCGKTTLLNIIGGLDKADSGKMFCQGVDTSHFSSSDWDGYRNSYVGFVFQENNLLEDYNVYDNIRVATDLQNLKDCTSKINESLKFVGLEDFALRKISQLSGGQKQRVAIARAIAKNSKILLADEPTGSLDPETGREIFELLKEISKTQLVVVVTHDLSSANEFGDQIIKLKDGQIEEISEYIGTERKESKEIFKTEKSVLKPKMCIKLATNTFKKTPVRLLVLILLSMFGFSLMVGALKFTTWEPYDLQHKVLEREGQVIVSLSPEIIDYGNGIAREEPKHFSFDDFEEFKRVYGDENVICVSNFDERYSPTGYFRQLTDREYIYFKDNICGKAVLSEKDFEAYGLELLAGSYPNEEWGKYDIAVSEHIFEIYSFTGFTYDGYEKIEINSYDDLIGKKVGGMYGDKYTIRGIINTNFDRVDFERIKKFALGQSDDFSLDWTNEFDTYSKQGFSNLMFMSPHYDEMPKEYPYIILKYDREMLDKSDLFYKVFEEEKYVFCDYYSQILKYQSEVTVDFGWKMIAISFVAILFAVILFANFIAVSIQDKIKQIGILRAIGATKNQISTIFVVQNSIIALFVFIFSSTVINYTIMPLLLLMGTSSKPFPFPLYELQVSDYLFLFVIIIVTSIIASLFPLLRLSRKTPRELMIK